MQSLIKTEKNSWRELKPIQPALSKNEKTLVRNESDWSPGDIL